MNGSDAARVVVCAGGLGTRIASWSRYIPKEFFPVAGRPGILHLLDEISQLGPAEVAVVCHPYYRRFTAWAQEALSQDAHDRYASAAGTQSGTSPAAGITVSFITQRGPYADLTSVLNGASHLGDDRDLYVAFADNLYPGASPLLALLSAPSGCPAIVTRAYQPELAGHRGVITTKAHHGQVVMRDLHEKPGPAAARMLERLHGTSRLLMLEGRARLTPGFLSYARRYQAPTGAEPKLALVLAAYARTSLVTVITTAGHVIDLGGVDGTDTTAGHDRSAPAADTVAQALRDSPASRQAVIR